MPKAFAATCLANVVTCKGVPVSGVVILSEGVAQSSGFLILDEDKTYYVAKTSPDLKTTIQKLVSITNKVTALFTSVGSGMHGSTTAVPPTLASDVAAIADESAILQTLSESMK